MNREEQMLTTDTSAELIELTSGDECRFCRVADREAIVQASETATAFPSLGALIEGWMLVAPRRHVVSTADLADAEWRDLAKLADAISIAMRAAYGPVVMFEHGASGSNRTAGCGVDHAHLHVVPWSGNLREQIAAVHSLPDFEWQPAGKRPTGVTNSDYIWISDDTGTWVTHSQVLPSQVVRQAISASLGLGWWDWKSDLRIQTAESTRRQLTERV